MIMIDENTYVVGYWFASDGENNWYCCILKNEDGEYFGQQTFRYNKGDEDPHLGKDEKSIYKIKIDKEKTEEEIIKLINQLFEVIKLKYNDYHDHFLVQSKGNKFFEIAKTKHYFNMKQAH